MNPLVAQPSGRATRWTTVTRLAGLVSAAALVLMAACGGGEDRSEYEQLAAQAHALKVQAEGLVQAGPCSEDSQCTALNFTGWVYSCDSHLMHTYSKLSPAGPDAERVAAEQRSVARQAMQHAPPPDIACTLQYVPPPRHVCEAQRCVQKPGVVNLIDIPAMPGS